MKLWSLAAGVLVATIVGCGAQPSLPVAGPGAPADFEALRAHKKVPPRQGMDPAPAINVENFSRVSSFLLRGGQPSDDAMKDLAKAGVTTDISLLGGGNNPKEPPLIAHEADVAKSLGITFVNIRIPFNRPFPQEMADEFLKIVDDEADKGGHVVFIHCTHGRDRTGTMISYYRIVHDHWSPQQALEEQETFGYKPKDYPTFTTFLMGLAN